MTGRCGHFDGPDAQECLKAAWGHAGGLEMSLSEFTDCLARLNFKPDYIRAGLYRLTLPDRPSR
jgi:hypothetical protein